MRFHNIVTQTQPEAGSLSGGFGGEEGLEDLVADSLRYSYPVIPYANLKSAVYLFRIQPDSGFIILRISMFHFSNCKECVADQVQDYPANILRKLHSLFPEKLSKSVLMVTLNDLSLARNPW
jgi:hypothetical protein